MGETNDENDEKIDSMQIEGCAYNYRLMKIQIVRNDITGVF